MRILNYFSHDERRWRRIERFRRRLPSAAVNRCEHSSGGDELLFALSCLNKIVQLGESYRGHGTSCVAHVDLPGTGTQPSVVSELSTESQLEALIAAIFREIRGSAHAPRVRDVIEVLFAGSTEDNYGNLDEDDHRWSLSWKGGIPKIEDIPKIAGDRLLLGVLTQSCTWQDVSYVGSGGGVINYERTQKVGLYGRVVRGDTAKNRKRAAAKCSNQTDDDRS
jgi:hypothetical protein